jgi:hypothetical protein
MTYVKGNVASDGTFTIPSPYKVIPFPENTCIEGAVLNFSSSLNKFSLTTQASYLSHDDSDGPNSLRVNKFDYHVQSAAADIVNLVGTFAMTYTDPGETALNTTVYSNATNANRVSL